jgi:flagellar biosynthesis protein FlhF
MKIRRFVDRDSRAAMARVREAMGPEAMILSNRRVAEGVEVVAALDLAEADIARALEAAQSGVQAAAEPERPAAAQSADDLAMRQLQKELAELRDALELQLGRRSWRDSAQRPATRATLGQRLARLGLSRALSGAILDSLPARGGLETQWQRALLQLANRLPIADAFPPPAGALACLGATGVGKTSVVAKLAGRAVLAGAERVALLSMDAWRIGAHEQLQTVADRLGVPFETATSAESLSRLLTHYRGYRLFIDTAGMSQRDSRLREQWQVLREQRPAVSCAIVLSASAQTAQTREVLRGFGPRDLCGAIITKVDEACSLGGVIDALVQSGVPLAMLADGQRVPDDIATVDARQVVARAVSLLESAPPAAGVAEFRDVRRAG